MKIALLGNPNTGKSSVFNMLSGLRQHVGNFPGVTVDKKVGEVKIGEQNHTLIDFPGTYSLYPRSKDEQVVYDVLTNPGHADYPDLNIVITDASNLERNLFFFSQVYDLGLPCMLVLNMNDLAERAGKTIDVEQLNNSFPGATIVGVNARLGSGKSRIIDQLEEAVKQTPQQKFCPELTLCTSEDQDCQENEAKLRFEKIGKLIKQVESIVQKPQKDLNKIDKFLVHPVFGYLIFAAILLVIFQFIYTFAAYPMDLIDGWFAELSGYLATNLPSGVFSDLISQGIVPGIGGVVIFIPQIAILFFFISLLEETGYLARVVFIMDRLMRPFGLNGKSVVPLLSSVACAIPGVMAARTITDWKERMITILVAPLMSCSARIPVYTLLIALVIPNETILGFLNLQGLVLFGLYALGLISALAIALFLKLFIKTRERGFLLLELPGYKAPQLKNVGLTVLEKVKVFVFDAGKVILAISVILWAMASYGPGNSMEDAEKLALKEAKTLQLSAEGTDQLVASEKLEHSYIGVIGKSIEPVIIPLGYDWKIGISLITSFAAREVFVGSLATIYAVHDDGEENKRLIDRLREEKRRDGTPVYSLAMGLSLMVYYVFAMQCMSTLAVVKRETKSWKWPLIQLLYMGVMAYAGAWITFIIFS